MCYTYLHNIIYTTPIWFEVFILYVEVVYIIGVAFELDVTAMVLPNLDVTAGKFVFSITVAFHFKFGIC